MSWRGVVSGSLGLIALEAIVRSNKSAGRFGELLEAIGTGVRAFLSPAVSGLPDLSGSKAGVSAGSQQYDNGSDGFSGGSGGGAGGGSSW